MFVKYTTQINEWTIKQSLSLPDSQKEDNPDL